MRLRLADEYVTHARRWCLAGHAAVEGVPESKGALAAGESWDRSKLQQRFFPDETLSDVACPASRSLRKHRDALCLAHRKDSAPPSRPLR